MTARRIDPATILRQAKFFFFFLAKITSYFGYDALPTALLASTRFRFRLPVPTSYHAPSTLSILCGDFSQPYRISKRFSAHSTVHSLSLSLSLYRSEMRYFRYIFEFWGVDQFAEGIKRYEVHKCNFSCCFDVFIRQS